MVIDDAGPEGLPPDVPLEGTSSQSRLGNHHDPLNKPEHKESSAPGLPLQSPNASSQLMNAQPSPMSNQPYPPGREQSVGNFNMSNLASSLPPYPPRGASQISYHDSQRFHGNVGNMPPYGSSQYHTQSAMGPSNFPMQSSPYQHSFQDHQAAQLYGQLQAAQRSFPGGPDAMQSPFAGNQLPPNMQQQYLYFPGQTSQMPAPPPYNTSVGQVGPSIAGRGFQGGFAGGSIQHPQSFRPNTTGNIPSTPRGPPRKPKQSGHALWVGNLPSGTAVGDLKDHFSKDATKDIESVFLISKSNCAFVNYRSDTACAAAMHRFHDSRFQGVRLVCRLRRSPNPTSSSSTAAIPGAPSAPAALAPEASTSQSAPEAITQNRQVSSRAAEEAHLEARRRGQPVQKVQEKFFIMKSLTIEDMELSVQNKIWATQGHNEQALNNAYETAENVYLIFSANKSGEYFGFARMASTINPEAAADLNWTPREEPPADDPDVPRSIPTPATEFAPKGRIIDDSARGTIFWEADLEDQLEGEAASAQAVPVPVEPEQPDDENDSSSPQSFGKPFRIEWISTERLPFYRTRGLRNPWNANREVKIARDGTELETSVGRRLIQMFQTPLDPRMAMPPYSMSR